MALHVPPSVLWQENPRDLATVVAVLEKQAKEARKR